MPEISIIRARKPQIAHKLRVAAYARVSSDSTDQQNSFAAQVAHFTELIGKNEDWELVDVYADEGLTGLRADKRDDFQRLLRDCRKGRVDKVLAKSISRFSRNITDCVSAIRELRGLGIEVYFEKENLNTSNMGSEMLLGILSTLAQEESTSISQNMRWSYQKRMRAGKFITCTAPYGYRLVNGTLVVEPQEAKIVRMIFDSYLSGKGHHEIARELEAIGSVGRNGTHWNPTTIRLMLGNEKYAGDALLQKTYATDTLPFITKVNKGEKAQYFVRNSHEGIVTREAQERVRALEQLKMPHMSPAPPNPLTAKIQCGICGHCFRRKRQPNGKVFWVCRNHDENKGNCPLTQIREDEIYRAFTRLYNKLRHNRRYILYPVPEQLRVLKEQAELENKQAMAIKKEIIELTERNLMLNRLRSKGYLDSALFIEQSNELNAKLAERRTALRHTLKSDEYEDGIDEIERLIDIVEDGHDALEQFDAALFGKLVERIVVDSLEHIRFELYGGLEFPEDIERTRR